MYGLSMHVIAIYINAFKYYICSNSVHKNINTIPNTCIIYVILYTYA